MQRDRLWFAHPVVCAAVGIAVGFAYLGARIWFNPDASGVSNFWLHHRFDRSAILAVLVGSSLWLYGQKLSGFTTMRRIHSAYGFLAVLLVVMLIANMALGRGPVFLTVMALLFAVYLWKVWRAGRRLPDAKHHETSAP